MVIPTESEERHARGGAIIKLHQTGNRVISVPERRTLNQSSAPVTTGFIHGKYRDKRGKHKISPTTSVAIICCSVVVNLGDLKIRAARNT